MKPKLICEKCGGERVRKSRDRYYCPPCTKAALRAYHQEKRFDRKPDRVCEKCGGTEFWTQGSMFKCAPCGRKYKTDHWHNYEKKGLRKKPLGPNVEIPLRPPRYRNVKIKIWEYLLGHPCIDCGEADPIVLEFDHVDPSTKLGGVSQLAAKRSARVVFEEIAKCEVRCANCHKRKTAKQFGFYKYIETIEN